MAYVEQVTKIANPATGRRKRRNVARRMTLKQKLHFGSSRQRAAAKASLSKKRHSKAKRRYAAPRKRVSRPRTQAVARRRSKRNIGEVVYLLGANPATKRRKGMATKSRRKAGSRKQSNPRRRQNRRRNPVMVTRRRHARRNPGGVNVMEYIKLGASVVGGAVGSKMLTQAVMSSSNTGITGYFGNLVATIALGYGAKMAFRDEKIAQGVVGGGLAQIIVRALSDNTPYGSLMSNLGVGDYQTNWNFVWPQRVQPGYPPRFIAPAALGGGNAPGMPVVTHAAPAGQGMGYASGRTLNRWN